MSHLLTALIDRVIPQPIRSCTCPDETKQLLEPADRYHRDHGETNAGLDLSRIVVPEPGESITTRQSEYEVKTKIGGEFYVSVFDYDPVGVTVGWSGDPIAFKLSAWDVPSATLPSTPPTSAVFDHRGLGLRRHGAHSDGDARPAHGTAGPHE